MITECGYNMWFQDIDAVCIISLVFCEIHSWLQVITVLNIYTTILLLTVDYLIIQVQINYMWICLDKGLKLFIMCCPAHIKSAMCRQIVYAYWDHAWRYIGVEVKTDEAEGNQPVSCSFQLEVPVPVLIQSDVPDKLFYCLMCRSDVPPPIEVKSLMCLL